MTDLAHFLQESKICSEKEYQRVVEQEKQWTKRAKAEERKRKKKERKEKALLPQSTLEKARVVCEIVVDILETDSALASVRDSIVQHFVGEQKNLSNYLCRVAEYEEGLAARKTVWSKLVYRFTHRAPKQFVSRYGEERICLIYYFYDYDEASAPPVWKDTSYINWSSRYKKRFVCKDWYDVPNGSALCEGFKTASFRTVLQRGMFQGWIVESFYNRVKMPEGYQETAELLLYRPLLTDAAK